MKKLYLLSIALGVGLSAMGAHLTPEQSLARLNGSAQLKSINLNREHKPVLSNTVGNLYIFSQGNGFIILPATDEAPALLGYSSDTEYKAGENPGLDYWLEFYNRELASINKSAQSDKITVARPERAPIEPLTQMRWNQESPYNNDCPEIDGKHTVTGCVATAMAQMMKYHSYPEKGKGSHSYTWSAGNKTLSYNYDENTFNWDLMPNIYNSDSTDEEKAEVANLMYACGVSVDMNYDLNDSGASSLTMGQSLINYFDYDRGLWMPQRDYYGIYEWEDMIYSNLAEELPVLYAGQGTAGGHQFICDGYSSDGYFHFNWGWGGLSDGYFLLTALNPASLGVGGGAGGFNSGQMVALDVRPPVEGSTPKYVMYSQAFVPMVQSTTAESTVSFTAGIYNYSMLSLPADEKIGVKIVSQDDENDVKYVDSQSDGVLGFLEGYNNIAIKIPALQDGNYILTPAFYADNKWNDVRIMVSNPQKVYASVSDGTITFSVPEGAYINVTDVTVPQEIYSGLKASIKFTVNNNSTAEYIGNIYPVLVNSSNNVVAQSVYRPVDVVEGSSQNIEDYIADFEAVNGADFTPGSYNLVFIDSNGSALSEPTPVTVVAAPENTSITVTDLKLEGVNPITDPSKVTVSFKVNCTEGYFADTLEGVIFHSTGGTSLTATDTNMIYVSADNSAEGTVTFDLSQLDNGEYMCVIFKEETQMSEPLMFTIKKIITGLDSVGDDNGDKVTVVYDLYGRRRTGKLLPGIYIVNGKKELIK